MVEKIGSIKNPLTVIAIFAGVADISGTIVLPFVSPENQLIYIWFVILFPVLLVLCFFSTLNFNHKVLYAPSDFKDESNFMKAFQKATPDEIEEKLKDEDVAVVDSQPKVVHEERAGDVERVRQRIYSPHHERQRYVEQLVLSQLEEEFNTTVKRDMRLRGKTDRVVFDGLITTGERVVGIEVKYVKAFDEGIRRLSSSVRRLIRSIESSELRAHGFSLVLAIVTDEKDERSDHIVSQMYSALGMLRFPLFIRVFSVHELEKGKEQVDLFR